MARILSKEEVETRRQSVPQADLRPLVEGMIRAVQSIEFPAPQIQVSAPAGVQPAVEVRMPEPIRQWVFSVQRDKDGFIKTITARAE